MPLTYPGSVDLAVRDRLSEGAPAWGLDRIGFARVGPFPDVRNTMTDRQENGLSGGLGFTYKDPDLATDVTASFPWACGAVVGIRAYVPDSGSAAATPGHGVVARFAVDDPYEPLRAALDEVAWVLRSAGHRAEVLVDDDRLVDRAMAVRAGVAWWGKSTMVLTPGLGPWFVIGTVVTDALLEADEPMVRGCGTCSACIPACPTGAIVSPGVLDARRCLAAILQTGGIIPRRWRVAVGQRIYGCDDCLDACPPGQRLLDTTTGGRGAVSLAWILEASDRTLVERFSHFYLPGRSPRILRRNAIVAMGNDIGGGHDEALAIHAGHPDWLLRLHAVWALGRTDSAAAKAVLANRTTVERHPDVIEELTAVQSRP